MEGLPGLQTDRWVSWGRKRGEGLDGHTHCMFMSKNTPRYWADSCSLHALSYCHECVQVAIEILKLTEDHGTDAWENPTLNKKPYSIAGVSGHEACVP
jgi:hypothetical protein